MKRLHTMATPFVLFVVATLCFSAVALADSETETTTVGTSTYGGSSIRFTMVSVSSLGYPHGNGSASIEVQGGMLAIHFQSEGLARGARLTLVLVANGTSHSVANMSASYDGEVEAEGTISLAPGYYLLGLRVLDTSSFSSPTQVLSSNPATEALSVGQGTEISTTVQSFTQTVNTFQGGETEDDRIHLAIQTMVIPAVVDIGKSGSDAYVNDGNFSVSVGRYQQEGYVVSISAANVAGPRVLLVNLTSAQARALFSGPFRIALDGSAVQQGSSLTQVLGAQSGDPARFVLVSSPSALSLLISIPHFSYHTITIVPIFAQVGSTLLVDLPVFAIGLIVVTAVVVVSYVRRTRLAI